MLPRPAALASVLVSAPLSRPHLPHVKLPPAHYARLALRYFYIVMEYGAAGARLIGTHTHRHTYTPSELAITASSPYLLSFFFPDLTQTRSAPAHLPSPSLPFPSLPFSRVTTRYHHPHPECSHSPIPRPTPKSYVHAYVRYPHKLRSSQSTHVSSKHHPSTRGTRRGLASNLANLGLAPSARAASYLSLLG